MKRYRRCSRGRVNAAKNSREWRGYGFCADRLSMAKSSKKAGTPQSDQESRSDPNSSATAPQWESDTTAAPRERDRIAMRAYELYLARGRGEGAAMDDWLRAEQEMTDSRPPSRDSES